MNPNDDLFDLANSLSALLGAPVTIEDSETAVVAYSGGQHDVDEARVETILGRRVPSHYRQALADAGVFDAIATSDEVEFFDLTEAAMTHRAVVATRADGILVGSIWMITPSTPSAEQRHVLMQAAPLVGRAIALARRRDTSDERQRRLVVETLLDGDEAAARWTAQVGWQSPLIVAAMRSLDRADDLGGPVSLHLSAMLSNSVCANINDTTYAVLAADHATATRVLGDLQRRLLVSGRPIAAGLGRTVLSASDLRRSRTDADMVLRSMLRRSVTDAVASPSSHFAELMTDHARSFLDTYESFGFVARLSSLEHPERAEMRQTLFAFLRAGGDITSAAAHLHVHPNTVRNRLRRARTSCGLDMDDPDTRSSLWTELRVLETAD